MRGDIPISGVLRDGDEDETTLLDELRLQGWSHDERQGRAA